MIYKEGDLVTLHSTSDTSLDGEQCIIVGVYGHVSTNDFVYLVRKVTETKFHTGYSTLGIIPQCVKLGSK